MHKMLLVYVLKNEFMIIISFERNFISFEQNNIVHVLLGHRTKHFQGM